jgi:ABC-type uncharacterized transport system auxiliary subunit
MGKNQNIEIKVIDKILLVEKIDIEEIYNDYRLVYRESPFQLNYYSYKFWIKKPDRVIRDAIVQYLSNKKVFNKVIIEFFEWEPDLIMKVRTNIIEEYDIGENWFAHLSMKFKIIDFKSGEVILTHKFDRKKRLIIKKVDNIPVCLSKILQEELDKVINNLSKKLK